MPTQTKSDTDTILDEVVVMSPAERKILAVAMAEIRRVREGGAKNSLQPALIEPEPEPEPEPVRRLGERMWMSNRDTVYTQIGVTLPNGQEVSASKSIPLNEADSLEEAIAMLTPWRDAFLRLTVNLVKKGGASTTCFLAHESEGSPWPEIDPYAKGGGA